MRIVALFLTLLIGPSCATVDGGATPRPSGEHLKFVDVHGTPKDPLQAGRLAVLVFITTDCPIANGYAPQLHELFRRYADRPVEFYLVHVDPDLDPDRARAHAAEYGYADDLPILLDPEHRLVARCGATITPEAALLSADGTLHYRGRINNWYGDVGRKRFRVSRHELRDAIDAVLAGKPVAVPRAAAVGCVIEPTGSGS